MLSTGCLLKYSKDEWIFYSVQTFTCINVTFPDTEVTEFCQSDHFWTKKMGILHKNYVVLCNTEFTVVIGKLLCCYTLLNWTIFSHANLSWPLITTWLHIKIVLLPKIKHKHFKYHTLPSVPKLSSTPQIRKMFHENTKSMKLNSTSIYPSVMRCPDFIHLND